MNHLFRGMRILIFCTYPVLVLLIYNHPELCIKRTASRYLIIISLIPLFSLSLSLFLSLIVSLHPPVSRFLLLNFRVLSYSVLLESLSDQLLNMLNTSFHSLDDPSPTPLSLQSVFCLFLILIKTIYYIYFDLLQGKYILKLNSEFYLKFRHLYRSSLLFIMYTWVCVSPLLSGICMLKM